MFPEAHYTLGVALAWLEQLDYAAQSFNLALSIQPGMVDAIEFLALLARRRGDEPEARRLRDVADRLLQTRGAVASLAFDRCAESLPDRTAFDRTR
jgi:hypothetical protein